MGCSLSAPATGGFSVVSPQYIRYAAGSEKEKRAGGRLHGGTIAHSFLFCKGVWRFLTFPRGPRERRGLMVADVVPPSPPSNVFRSRGTPPVPPAGAAPPAPCLGEAPLLILARPGRFFSFPRGGEGEGGARHHGGGLFRGALGWGRATRCRPSDTLQELRRP